LKTSEEYIKKGHEIYAAVLIRRVEDVLQNRERTP
jgi:hypothetical protein